VVLAGGEGARLRPLTLARPKPMIPVGPEPVIYYLLSQLSREGFEEIVMVTGYLRQQIKEYLGDGARLGLKITYAVKPDEFLCGTAGSLKLAEHLLDDTFLVAQADTLSEIPLKEAMSFHRSSEAQATIVLTRVNEPSEFGVAVLDGKGVITAFQEKPTKAEARSNLVSTGFYILEPEVIDYIANEKWDFARDLFPHLLKLHRKLSGFVSDAFWVDIGNLEGYLRGVKWVVENTVRPLDAKATGVAHLVRADWKAGIAPRAQITDPVLIEEHVTIEDKAKVGKYCMIKRNAYVSSGTVIDRSVVMERTSIGRNCTIRDSVIGQSAVLQDDITVDGSIIGPGCVIGDRVRVLKGSRVWTNVRIRSNETVNGIIAAPLEKAFHFYTGFGQYTGLLATSIEGFMDALGKVPIESIEFHAKRRDYERWVRGVLAANELADGMEELRRAAVTGEELRSGLIGVTKKWVDEVLESQNQ
jgi:NDP-sugar pyrophosphorylase family protein